MKTVLLISDSEVCTSILDLYENNSMVVEPAGALSVAAVIILLILVGENERWD